MTQLRVGFRVDASPLIGGGHVARCLTLANAMRERGAAAAFVCADDDGGLCDRIDAAGIKVRRIAAKRSAGAGDWQGDAAATKDAFASIGFVPDWMVVDHYRLDARWEDSIRDSASAIVAIDDMADRPHSCDVLLDQNVGEEKRLHYSRLVPTDTRMLLGPSYALLQPRYAQLHPAAKVREGRVRRVFVFFSAGDSENLTGRCLSALLRCGQSELKIDVVLAGANPHAKSIRRDAERAGNVEIHEDVPTLADLMLRADMGVGASGATSWERCCMGLPALVVSMGANQRPIAAALHQLGVVNWIGDGSTITDAAMETALRDALAVPLIADWSRRCLSLVDGLGADRVCDELSLAAAENVS